MGVLNEKANLGNQKPKEKERQNDASAEICRKEIRGEDGYSLSISRCQLAWPKSWPEMSDNLEVAVARLEIQVERLETDFSEMKADLKAIRKTLDQASGGWRVMVMIGGFSAAMGALATKVISVWPFPR